MLELKNVVAAYGQKIRALKGVSLSIEAGEIVCLIGSNGSGKSSLLHAISGLLPVMEGDIIFNGENLAGLPAHQIAARGVIHVPEGRRIFPKLTVLENLEMGAFTKKRDAAAQRRMLEKVFSFFPIVKDRLKQLGGTLSGGEQQMLAIGRALMAEPKLLMLDEPSMGLAPIIVEKIFRIIHQINAEGTTILLVEQNAYEALKIARRGYVLQTGRVVLEDKAAALLENADVKKYYLGVH